MQKFQLFLVATALLVSSEAISQAGREFPPEQGSGKIVESGAASFPPDLLRTLSNAEAEYSAYELGAADVGNMQRARENFVDQSVFEPDKRTPVGNKRDFPSRAVVQILFKTDRNSSALCSGAMISKDTVLTAAHCIHSGTASGKFYKDFQVFPGRAFGATPFGRCKAVEKFILEPWSALSNRKRIRMFDLGALKLDCDIGERTGWFGLKALPDLRTGRATTVQGYANDKAPVGQQWKSADKVRSINPLKVFYQNDTYGGTSGSPVFVEDQPSIFCVHTNGRHGSGQWRRNNACTRITPQNLLVIASWIDSPRN